MVGWEEVGSEASEASGIKENVNMQWSCTTIGSPVNGLVMFQNTKKETKKKETKSQPGRSHPSQATDTAPNRNLQAAIHTAIT